jgi:hypothetical protein
MEFPLEENALCECGHMACDHSNDTTACGMCRCAEFKGTGKFG